MEYILVWKVNIQKQFITTKTPSDLPKTNKAALHDFNIKKKYDFFNMIKLLDNMIMMHHFL